jgi:Ca2+/Na+ antiporter
MKNYNEMDLERAKRFSAFIYYIPAIIIIMGKLPIPEMAFLVLPLPYYAVFYYLYTKTEKSERNKIEFARLALVTIAHFVLYYLMFLG